MVKSNRSKFEDPKYIVCGSFPLQRDEFESLVLRILSEKEMTVGDILPVYKNVAPKAYRGIMQRNALRIARALMLDVIVV